MDFPGVSCENCREAEEIDGASPDCRNCLIPPLDEKGQRVLEIRTRLVALKDLVDAGTILRFYDASKEDIELLAAIEEELKNIQKHKDSSD